MIASADASKQVTPASATRLKVRDLSVRLGASGADIVDEVRFDVDPGEVMGLVGESGSGKTTVALALLGYARRGLAIAGGSVEVDGVDLLALPPEALRRARGSTVAYVPQDPSSALNPALRVDTQLVEVLKAHPGVVDDIEDRVDEVLREVSLSADLGHLRRYPHQLSGGQQQRVALAMAFACRPALVVLDEPTTGLDVTTQRHVLETVRDLCKTYGVAAVYVSHDLAVVSGLASTVAVMYAGRVIEFGPAERVFSRPTHPYTEALCAAVPSPDQMRGLVGLEGNPPRPGRRPIGCSFAARCSYRTEHCLERDPDVVSIDQRQTRCFRVDAVIESSGGPLSTPLKSLGAGGKQVLRVDSLSAWYGDAEVVSDVSFAVPDGSCLAIVGESGSGKTTLARCISGQHSRWSGTVAFNGHELPRSARERSRDVLRGMRYVFQNPYTSLNPRSAVAQLVEQPLTRLQRMSRSERRSRVAKALEDMALGPQVGDAYPDELSGGERQRVAIARALVVEPTLLVCDEVTSALDVSVQALVIELLRRLQQERGLSLIFITHNLAVVRSLAQDAVVLAAGRIVEAGTVDRVMDAPQDPYTAQLMADVPRPNPRMNRQQEVTNDQHR